MRGLWGAWWIGIGWGQSCGQPYDLTHLDSLWLDGLRTITWLSRHIRRYRLVEARTGALLTKAFIRRWERAALLSLCQERGRWQWIWVRGQDTTVWLSDFIPPCVLSRHLMLLRGPAAQPLTVAIGVPLRFRSADLEAEERALGWAPQAVARWESLLVGSLALKAGYSPAGITALVLIGQKTPTGYRLTEVQLYGRRSAFLPRDEVLVSYPRRVLVRAFLRQLQSLAYEHPPYGYVIRLNDYHPQTVAEGVSWTLFLNEPSLPRPALLLDTDGHVRSDILQRLAKPPTLPPIRWE